MTQDTDSEEDIDSSDLLKLKSSCNQISSVESSTHRISVTEGSKSFPGGRITIRRTIYQVEEEIATMEVHSERVRHSEKPPKTAVQKASKFGGRLLKSLFDSSPAEVVFTEHKHQKVKEREHKEADLKSSSNKSSSSSGSGGKPYTIANASPPPPPRKPADPIELSGYEEPFCSPLYPVARKNHHRQDTHDNFITPGIRAYPKPREPKENSKYSLEKDSPGRSSRTTSTETSSHSNTFESDLDFSTDSTGDRTSRREKERSQQALIDRLHAEALKMKLEKAEEEMQKLRMEVYSKADPQKPTQLDAYRSDSNSNQQSSVDGGDRRGISRINSLEDSTHYGDRRQQEPYDTSYGSAGRPEIATPKSAPLAIDGEPQVHDDSDHEIPPLNWVDYQSEVEVLEDPPMQVDNAWRSAQMYTFLQDAAAVNTVNAAAGILKDNRSEKKVAFTVQKREQQSRAHSRSQSRVESPTHFQQEQLQQQRVQLTQQQQQDPRYVQSNPHSRHEDSPTAKMHQQQQVHSVERTRSVETLSSTSSTTTQQQRHVMQRTKSVESNSSSKSGHSQTGGGQSVVSLRSRSNTTIAERISRTHNVMNMQQSMSTSNSTSQTENHRHPQMPAVSNFQMEPTGYRQPQLGFDPHPQSQPMPQQPVEQHHQTRQAQQHSDHHRQPQSMPQHELLRQSQSAVPQPELFGRQQQQLEFQIHRQSEQQYREQSSVVLQPVEQLQRLSHQQPQQSTPQQQQAHQRSSSLTFPTLPQLTLELSPSYEPEDAVSSPLQLSPTSSGLITPTGMTPPTAFQSDEERAAWQHQRTMERMYNARRNREALLLKQRGATAAR